MWLERMGVKLTWGMVISMFTSYADLFGVLMLFMVLDFISGYAKGYVTKTLNSTRSGIGIIKKFIIMCLVMMAHYLRIISGYEGIELLVLYFFIANECLSILENAGAVGLPLPKRLIKALEQLKGE